MHAHGWQSPADLGCWAIDERQLRSWICSALQQLSYFNACAISMNVLCDTCS